MNISLNRNCNINFKAKSQNIKKADDLQRTARLNFPVFSPSYVNTFYKTGKDNPVMQKEETKLTAIRKIVKQDEFKGETLEERNLNAPIFVTLRGMKAFKTGNCHEAAAATMATLAANGIYNLRRVNLELEVQYINKENGKVEYKEKEPIDHTAIIANINGEKIVIDSWMGFADSQSEAKTKYNKAFIDEKMEKKLRYHRSMFRVEKAEKGEIINPDDKNKYERRTNIKFVTAENSSPYEIRLIGQYTRNLYPELIKS